MYRIGNGFDIHSFEKSKKLVLGGIYIEYEYGLKAHSDGDVVIHSLIDALLGASGNGDIGEIFPDIDPTYKDINSVVLLNEVLKIVKENYSIINIDITIICEKPKLTKYKDAIRKNLSEICCVQYSQINIKAKTMEKIGPIGKGEGIAVISSCMLKHFE